MSWMMPPREVDAWPLEQQQHWQSAPQAQLPEGRGVLLEVIVFMNPI